MFLLRRLRENLPLVFVTVGLYFGMVISWPLWSMRGFPINVPLISLGSIDPLLTALCIVLLVGGGFLALFLRREQHHWLWVSVAAGVLLCLLDIHRLQPWFYMYIMIFGIYAARSKGPLRIILVLLAGVYFWAGLHKLNPLFISQVVPFLSSPFAFIPPILLQIVGWGAGIVELLLGLGLVLAKTRRISIVGLILMHLCVLGVLSVLQWNTVVWPWNLVLIGILGIAWNTKGNCFGFQDTRIAITVFVLTWILPVLCLWNLWPAYLSFSLYSGTTSDMRLMRGDEITHGLNNEFMTSVGVPPFPETWIYERMRDSYCKSQGQNQDFVIMERDFFGNLFAKRTSC